MTKTPEKTFSKKEYDKNYDNGYEFGYESGRLNVFADLLKIKYTIWSVHHVNNKEWKLGDKNINHPLDINVDKPLKIIYNYHWYEYDESTKEFESFNKDLYGKAKNNTIGEVWKGIEKLYIKYGLEYTDHKFIEDINIEDDVLKFYTGS